MEDVHIAWPQAPPLLSQLFVARQLCAEALDSAFEGLAAPKGSTILLYNETDAGLGDVAFATKLSRLIAEHLPEVQLTLVSSDVQKQANFELPEGVELMSEAEFLASASAQQRRPSLVVSAPGIFDHCRLRDLAYERLGISAEVPFQYIAEYGSLRQLKDDAFKSMIGALDALGDAFMDEVAEAHGLDPEDMGYSAKTGAVVGLIAGEVTPLEHLMSAYTRPHHDNPMAAWLSAPLLSARSCGLALGELGVHLEEPTPLMRPEPRLLDALEDAELKGLLLGETSAQVYADERALYVGYAYEGLARFCDIVALLERARGRDIDLVCPHRERAGGLMESLFDAPALERLSAYGVGRVTLVGCGEGGALERAEKGFGEGKTLRLITRYPIPNADLKRLHQASEPATMVSGDQSFSEAVSMGKVIVYLEPVYCQTFHLDAVVELAREVAPSLAAVLEFGMQYTFDERRYPLIQAHLSAPGFYEEASAFNQAVQRDHACGERLINLLRRALWTHHADGVAEVAKALLKRAFEAADVGRGVTLLGSELAALAARAKEGP